MTRSRRAAPRRSRRSEFYLRELRSVLAEGAAAIDKLFG
jgi:hypothetical protein